MRAEALTAPGAGETEERCRNCGGALADDQEWCLQCGAARTLLRRPPDWRIPLALLIALVMLVAIGVVVAVTVAA